MKKIIILLFLFLAGTLSADVYYNIGIEEGGFYSDSLSFINNIYSDIGYIYSVNKQHALIGYYQLKFAGPGIGNSVEATFSERSQDHYFMLKHLWKINKDLTIKPGISFLKEFFKFGKNEEWGSGLYDLNKLEGGVELNYKGFFKLPVSLIYKYQLFRYPNYADLLTMYLTSFQENKEIENYKSQYISLSINAVPIAKSFNIDIEYDLSLAKYDNKKVLTEEGYTGSAQRSDTHMIGIKPRYSMKFMIISLGLLYNINNSNQNYIYGSGQISLPEVIDNFYTYTMYTIKPAFSILFSKEKYLSLMMSYSGKQYAKRPAQDRVGEFLDVKMKGTSLSAGLSYHSKVNNHFSWSPLYIFAVGDSNNKYERTTRYNYSVHLLSFKFNYEY